MLSVSDALVASAVMTAVTVACRAFPFLFLSGKGEGGPALRAFVSFVERSVPPVAMTCLAVTALASADWGRPSGGPAQLAAAAAVVFLHLRWRNVLLSIVGGTAIYMILSSLGA